MDARQGMSRREILERLLCQTDKYIEMWSIANTLTALDELELTVEEINLTIWKASNNWHNTHAESADGYVQALAQAIHEAQQRKRGKINAK